MVLLYMYLVGTCNIVRENQYYTVSVPVLQYCGVMRYCTTRSATAVACRSACSILLSTTQPVASYFGSSKKSSGWRDTCTRSSIAPLSLKVDFSKKQFLNAFVSIVRQKKSKKTPRYGTVLESSKVSVDISCFLTLSLHCTERS